MNCSTIEEAIEASGMSQPYEVIEDGEIHRYPADDDRTGNKSCWYVSHGEWGAFGNWKSGQKYKWRMAGSLEGDIVSREEIERLKAARKKIEEAKQAKAAAWCQGEWECAASRNPELLDTFSYAERKQITPYGARVGNLSGTYSPRTRKVTEFCESILVPMYYRGELVNLQNIYDDGSKYFEKGARVKGCCMAIGNDPSRIVICEGYATGCSLHQYTGDTIVIAFNAGNLKPVALWLQEEYPDAQLLIAADNDAATELKRGFNPGIEKAEEAAAAVGGGYIYPDFSNEPFNGTDFNDYLIQGGKL